MAFCKKCGNQIPDGSPSCPQCGAPVDVDRGGFGWGLLGCCVPIAGLILDRKSVV